MIEYAALRPVLDLPIWIWAGRDAEAQAKADADDYNRHNNGTARVAVRHDFGHWKEL